MKTVRTWILVADAGRARVLQSLGPGKPLTTVDGLASVSGLPSTTHEIVTDRQTRVHESSNSARHAITPKTDPREQMKEDYLKMLADEMHQRLATGAFDRLVVVAPPHALGVLRAALSDQVKAVVSGELAKDLTKTPDHDMPGHLADVLRG